MLEQSKKNAEQRMQKSLSNLKEEFTKMRTGRASPSLLDHVNVDYYGSETPLNQVANVSVLDARTLSVAPWEKSLIPQVEKAIMKADLGLNPVTSGDMVRVPMPPLNEERRKEFVRMVKAEAENSRIAVRNIRRDANGEAKNLLKEKTITEDDSRKFESQIQQLTDTYIKKVDELLAEKEKDLMEI